MNSRIITEIKYSEARNFFLKNSSYINFDIPFYFNFEVLLSIISGFIARKKISDICKSIGNKVDKPCNYDQVNHVILSNKDGAYSWRPMQIIHPILYVHLVRLITEKRNWESIQLRFKKFSEGYVHCISLPRESDGDMSDKASLVEFWWERIEQESIKKSLEFNYLFKTDITDCYGSIYTHSIEWALDEEGKEAVKERIIKQKRKKTFGGEIDIAIRNMSYNQTNGIPQGSTLMDFIAEIVLGYADEQLTERIQESNIKKDDFYVLRYRDDYRVFVNDPNIGYEILKLLSSVLYDLGMKLNPSKTSDSNDVIISSIKIEKMERIFVSPSIQKDLQKEALRIYQLSKKYPNSGLVSKELSLFFDSLDNFDDYKNKEDLGALIIILTMIAYFSPRVINWVSAIVSILFEFMDDIKKKTILVNEIHNRFSKIPKTGLIDIWLQRISAPLNISINYSDKITKVALGEIKNSDLWSCVWLKEEAVNLINSTDLSSLSKKIKDKSISPVIQREEVELFKVDYL